jgi:SAM-dependent methyltransferase
METLEQCAEPVGGQWFQPFSRMEMTIEPVKRRRHLLGAGLGVSLTAAFPRATFASESHNLPEVPFVATPMKVVARMLDMAQVGPKDYLIDLGCGDGRIVTEAAKRGARAVGIDLDSYLIELCRRRARENNLEHLASFEQKDIYEVDLSPATVVTMYLLPEHNLKLRDKLKREVKHGTRVLSHDWDMGDWIPDQRDILDVPDKPVGGDKKSRVLMWAMPPRVGR